MTEFIDPYTGAALLKGASGNLCSKERPDVTLYESHGGCFDFVRGDATTRDERIYYDREYARAEAKTLSPEQLRKEWVDGMTPWRSTLLASLGEMTGRRVLLVGNGETTRELFFAMSGANVILTDLSLEGVRRMKAQFETSDLGESIHGSIEFHAVDALHLPFPDESFDLIYGAAFVHHLQDQDQFFHEVWRCLRSGGVCRFIDQAHSPVWETLKKVLWPLKRYSYWRDPRSPGDLESDRRGGYTEEGLRLVMRKHNFRALYFTREWFIFRIVSRHYGKLVHYRPSAMARARRLFLCMKWIDSRLASTSFMRNNGLMLTWGFSK